MLKDHGIHTEEDYIAYFINQLPINLHEAAKTEGSAINSLIRTFASFHFKTRAELLELVERDKIK